MSAPKRSRTLGLAAALVLLSCSGRGASGAPRPDPSGPAGRGVLLIAVDALRADHLSSFGYDRPTTVSLDELADQGITFTNTWAAAPRHIPAHAALLTGCWPDVSRRNLPTRLEVPESARWALPVPVPRMAVSFLASGFATAAFLDTGSLVTQGGYDDGFQVFDYDELRRPRLREERGGEAVIARFRAWLASLEPDRSWFAYLHLKDLVRLWFLREPDWEEPFEPRPALRGVPPVSADDQGFHAIPRTKWSGRMDSLGVYEARYDAALRHVDALLGGLFRTLRLEGRWRDTTVAVVGTHGLQLGEAGLYLDAGLFSDADLHVPFLLRPAAGLLAEAARGSRVDQLASVIDVPATLLDLAGLAHPAGMHGRSHADAAQGNPREVREWAFASCGLIEGDAVIGRGHVLERLNFARTEPVTLERWFGREPREDELVQETLRARGGGPSRVAPDSPTADAMREAAAEWRGSVRAAWAVLLGRSLPHARVDPETRRRLVELGYLAGEQRTLSEAAGGE